MQAIAWPQVLASHHPKSCSRPTSRFVVKTTIRESGRAVSGRIGQDNTPKETPRRAPRAVVPLVDLEAVARQLACHPDTPNSSPRAMDFTTSREVAREGEPVLGRFGKAIA
uniref:Uncharacterized protein n=1 Tax=Solanum tuberosum TaxID=4113 RepID=M1DGT0_SOLTU